MLIARALVAGAQMLGIPREELAQRAGLVSDALPPELLADPDARLPSRVVLALWDYLPRASGKADFGLWLAEALRGAPLSVAWWVILSSDTLGVGLERAVRYQRLLHDDARSEFSVNEREAVYRHRIGEPPFRPPSHAIEFGFASFLQLAERGLGQPVKPLRVRLQHSAPPDTTRHEQIFGSGVAFSETEDELVLERSLLELPLVSVDPALREIVESHANALLQRLPPSSDFGARVRLEVRELLRRGAVTIDELAQKLALPRRTLQRRLQHHGTNFGQVLDEVRRELALSYLEDPRMSVQETAFLLGFSDVSAFHRAFQRWTGTTPARVRPR